MTMIWMESIEGRVAVEKGVVLLTSHLSLLVAVYPFPSLRLIMIIVSHHGTAITVVT